MDKLMREIAEVVEYIAPSLVKVELVRTSACGECRACSDNKKIVVTARNSIDAKVGDIVNIDVKSIKKTAIIFVYIMPIILLFVGFYIGKLLFKDESLSILTSILLPALYVITAVVLEKRKKNINCDIISVVNS